MTIEIIPIDIFSYFENHRLFPWDVLGYSVPKYGQPHSYVASMLAPFANRIEKPLLEGRPSMGELLRLSEVIKRADLPIQLSDFDAPFMCHEIYSYFSSLYEYPKCDRLDAAQEVLNSLRRFECFRDAIRKRLDHLRAQGLFYVGDKHLNKPYRGSW